MLTLLLSRNKRVQVVVLVGYNYQTARKSDESRGYSKKMLATPRQRRDSPTYTTYTRARMIEREAQVRLCYVFAFHLLHRVGIPFSSTRS